MSKLFNNITIKLYNSNIIYNLTNNKFLTFLFLIYLLIKQNNFLKFYDLILFYIYLKYLN